MIQRCPTSGYIGIARLNGYRWLINDRGYANVVEILDNSTKEKEEDEDVVWGLVYTLQSLDEENLDINEGVPVAYTKENLTIDFWPASGASKSEGSSRGSSKGSPPNTTKTPQEKEMLVYIDRNRTSPDKPKREYIYRMNMGIKDAVEEGMPMSYVDKVLRNFIPDEGDGDVEVQRFARKQAVLFEDEN